MARLERDLRFYVPAMMCEVFAFSHKGLENPSENQGDQGAHGHDR
jgi:hypothetical protein